MYITTSATPCYVYVVYLLLQSVWWPPDGVVAWPAYCPGSCVCGLQTSSSSQVEHHTVDCSSKGLTSPPTNMSQDVETLILHSDRIHMDSLGLLKEYNNPSEIILSQNHIYGIDDVSVVLSSLLFLNLDNNELDYLSNKSFWWSPNLRKLSARNNKIELMHAQAFSGLADLKSLDLTGNRLFAIIADWFKGINGLRELNLSHNNIHVIRDESFHKLEELRSLDLSYNQIQHIYDGAFNGLKSLGILMLQGNIIKIFPLAAVQRITSLREINMNHNLIVSLDSGAVADLNLTTIYLSHMENLNFIDRHSFSNLPLLVKLDLSNNRILNYIDPESFHNVPRLERLLVDHDNLTVIEDNMLLTMPALVTLTLDGNRLHCDCNLWWLIDEISHHRRNLTLPSVNNLICDAPGALKDTRLVDIKPSDMSRTCAPRILPLFLEEYKIDLGDMLKLNCRAVGRPVPQTDWLLPARQHGSDETGVMVLKTGEREGAGVRRIDEHISITLAGTLSVDYVQGPDTGEYTCLASNPHGRDERTAHVHVTTQLADVIILGVTYNSITVTWRSHSYKHEYQILYKRRDSNETYHSVTIERYMRSFTANGLLPQTKYEMCIAMQQGNNIVRINCTVVQTHLKETHGRGGYNVRNYIIGGAAGSIILLVLIMCTLTYFIKKYNQRNRAQEELYSDNMSQLFLASMDSMSNTTPITYENRGAQMFDDEDIEEIRNTASMPSCSTNNTIIM